MSGAVYYDVTETPTNWFIYYGFYHPRDWSDGSFESEHENDFEGVLAVVRKDGSLYGKLEAIFTNAHGNLWPYSPAGLVLGTYYEYRDENHQLQVVYYDAGEFSVESDRGIDRPKVTQESGGHACYAWRPNDDNGSLVYYPSMTAVYPPVYYSSALAAYRLVDLREPGGLWDHQLEQSELGAATQTFHTWGWLNGNTAGSGCGGGATLWCNNNAASAPWNWGGPYGAELGPDPVSFVNQVILSGLAPLSDKYCKNAYLEDLKGRGFTTSDHPDGLGNIDLDALYDRLTPVCAEIDTALLMTVL